MTKKQISIFLSNAVLVAFASEDRPNILVLSIEDTSWYEFACYGNKSVQTPNIDQMGRDGVMFRYAYSNSPQSSPARSGLITGCYSSTYAMEQHRSNPATPANLFYPQLLRDAGYYCTNNQKTDYNTTTDNKSCWDECDVKASYNSAKRPVDKPFFSIYNTGMTHMGRVRSYHTDGRRDFTKDNIFVDNAPLPAHLPDLPEVRSDYAFHLEGVKDVDKWVGIFINDLKARGLYENTIIFFFSDHGGCSPRGKGYLYETSLRVPMVVYVPQKYKDQYEITEETGDKPVCFVDLAPTFLQLAGVQAPARYQGESFFKPLNGGTKYQYGVCGNQASHFQPLRSVSDGRYKYIRRFIPYKQNALRNYYQWGMPANIAWDLAYQEKRTNDITDNPFQCKVAEELFDLSVDSFETNNLVNLPEFAEIKASLRQKVDEFVTNTVDLGYVLPSQRIKVNIYNYCRAPEYPLAQLHRLANLTCRVQLSDLPELETALTSTYPEIKFWAVVNIAQLAIRGQITTAPAGLKSQLSTTTPELAAEAAYALCYLGEKTDAMNFFMSVVRSKTNYQDALSLMEVLSLDDRANEFFTQEIITELKNYTAVSNYDNQTNIGLLIRGILVNLNEFPANGIYDSSVYQEGLNVNIERRSLTPVPGGVSAYTPFFMENFKPINGQSSVALTSLDGKTDNPGWQCSSTGVFAQNSSQLLGGLRLSSTTSTLAWAETPTLDLSKPVVLEFFSKKWTNTGEGSFYAVIKGDTILSVMNPNNTISARISEAFYSGENTPIRFSGKMVANNNICFDSIRVSLSDESALNLPLAKVVNMGEVAPGGKLTYNLPVKVVNGAVTLKFNLPKYADFSIDGDSVIELEEMTNTSKVVFAFDAPQEAGTYTIKVEVDCGTDFPSRVIWLNATVNNTLDVNDAFADDVKVKVLDKKILISGSQALQANLFSITGIVLEMSDVGVAVCQLTAPFSGIFLLKVTNSSGSYSCKLVIK
jgi:N-sulfoglucosamine sulfohydrolase